MIDINCFNFLSLTKLILSMKLKNQIEIKNDQIKIKFERKYNIMK